MSQSNQEIREFIASIFNPRTLTYRDVANGLDQDLNPILEDDGRLEPRPDEKDIRACEPLRNVDWQGEAQEMGPTTIAWLRMASVAALLLLQERSAETANRERGFSAPASSILQVTRSSPGVLA